VDKGKSFGPFEVRGEVGHGAGGVVYVAFDPTLERTAAVKLYTSAPRDASKAIARLRRDAQAAGALGHPNIAAVLGVGEHEGQPWVATEFVAGVSLAQVLRSRAPMPIERVLDVWRQLCEGLAHAHREGVFHLDLKPADVRLTPAGEVKLVDFGSWHLKALEHRGPGPAEEGLHYRAPELLAGRRPDRKSDIFSVGAIVYELISYRKAFPGDSTTDIVRSLTRAEPDLACLPRTAFTPGFERVLGLSLARSPADRHASFEEVHADLVQLVKQTVPRLRTASGEPAEGPPEREELLAAVTRARAEDRLEEAMEGCRKLLELDPDDEAARRAMSEIESVLVDREVDALVGMALTYAADGEFPLATEIAEKVERLAPWSPRYLRLQVYLDEEDARRKADALVATAREHLAAGRAREAREAVQEALATMPSHGLACRLLEQLPEAPAEPSPPALAAPLPERPLPEPPLPESAVPEPPAGKSAVAEPAVAAHAAHALGPPALSAAPDNVNSPEPVAAPEAGPAAAPGPATAASPEPGLAGSPEPGPAGSAEPAPAGSPKPSPAESHQPLAPGPSETVPAGPPQPAGAVEPRPAAPADPRAAEAVTLSAAALQHFLKDEHDQARKTVERALALDPTNRRALELDKILRVLG
jgi:tetratricopeptide (TPR) repeat protein